MVADAYFLRVVFHSWPDEYCVKILRRLVPALRNNTGIVVNDSVVSEPGTLPLLGVRDIWRIRAHKENISTAEMDLPIPFFG